MLVMRDATLWLDHVDPWSEREALDLLRALQVCGPAGIFECAATADGAHSFVLAAHAEAALLLSCAADRQTFVDAVCERFGFTPVLQAAANESRPMPLLDWPRQAQH
jgi:hypothetical protein